MRTWLDAPDRCGIPPKARSCHIVAGVFTPVLAKHSKSFSPDRLYRGWRGSNAATL